MLRTILALTTTTFALVSTASAAVMVFGTGPERGCFEAAERRDNSTKALELCNEALRFSPLIERDRAATFVNRSVIHLGRNDPELALRDTRSAMDIQENLAAAMINRSAAYLMLGKPAEARKVIDAAMPLATPDERKRALYNRAIALEALGDVKGAYRDLKQAVAIDPTFEAAQLELVRYQVR